MLPSNTLYKLLSIVLVVLTHIATKLIIAAKQTTLFQQTVNKVDHSKPTTSYKAPKT